MFAQSMSATECLLLEYMDSIGFITRVATHPANCRARIGACRRKSGRAPRLAARHGIMADIIQSSHSIKHIG
jgi:hypothetical protein